MYNAILFDLDDTLLRNEMNTFVNAYWGTLLPKITKVFPDHHIPKKTCRGSCHKDLEFDNHRRVGAELLLAGEIRPDRFQTLL